MSLRKEKLTEKSGHTKVNRKERAKEISAEQIAEGTKRKPHPDKTKLDKKRKLSRKGRAEEKKAIASQSLEPVTLKELPRKKDPEAEIVIHQDKITSDCSKLWLGNGKDDK